METRLFLALAKKKRVLQTAAAKSLSTKRHRNNWGEFKLADSWRILKLKENLCVWPYIYFLPLRSWSSFTPIITRRVQNLERWRGCQNKRITKWTHIKFQGLLIILKVPNLKAHLFILDHFMLVSIDNNQKCERLPNPSMLVFWTTTRLIFDLLICLKARISSCLPLNSRNSPRTYLLPLSSNLQANHETSFSSSGTHQQ